MNGYGEMSYEDGRVFKGTFYNDQKHGEGVFIWNSGKKIEGFWILGK